MTSPADSFIVALNRFKQRLSPVQVDKIKTTTLEDVKQEMVDIQAKQRDRRVLRNLPRISSFLEAMEQFGKVVEVFLNDTPILSYVWGPLKLLLQTARCTMNSYETLLDAYSQISESLPLIEGYKDLFEHDTRMQAVLVMMFEDILYFHQRALRIFQQPMWQRLYKDLWQDFKAKFSDILRQLKRHKELVESQGLFVHLKQHRDDRERLFREFDMLKSELAESRLRSIVDWIAAAATSADHDATIRVREKETGKWILRLTEVADWIDSRVPSSSILWLNGKPGAGKTVLASVILEYLITDQKRSTAYFYCKHNDPAKRSYQAVLKGILSQLAGQEKHLLPFFQRRQQSSTEVTLTSTKTCEFLLDTVLRNMNDRTYVVIDGLDECSKQERKDILAYFGALVKKCDLQVPGRLRVLFLSQDEPDIEALLRTASKRTLRTDDNMQDISRFVGQHCDQLRRKFPDLEENALSWISRTVCQKADGMFLFAKLVMENLTAQETLLELQNELLPGRFPEGLHQAYERIVSRILGDAHNKPHENKCKLVERLLKWIISARRPLTWREIQAMASLDLETSEIDFNGRQIRSKAKELCGSLIDVLPGDRIEFVHQTASYYLSTHVFVRKAEADMSLATICLQYLTLECFEDPYGPPREAEFASKGYFAFEDYATAHWGDVCSVFEEMFDCYANYAQHLLATVKLHNEDMEKDPDAASPRFDEFGRATEYFHHFYGEDLGFDFDESGTATFCRHFLDHHFYDELVDIVGNAQVFAAMRNDQRDEIQLQRLERSLKRHRHTLESLSDSLNFGRRAALVVFYGENWFKCSKLTCYYFHEGFYSHLQLEQHQDRHERPYCCTYEDCAFWKCGLASAKLLQKHKQKVHAETEERPDTFGALQLAPEIDFGKRFKCHICNKSLGRSFNLKMHMLSHEDKREQPCAVCGKSFVRRYDRIRHERTIHNFHSATR